MTALRSLHTLHLLAGLVACLVFWSTPHFPSVDLWNHLAVVEAQHAALTHSGPLAALYGVEPTLYPKGLVM